MTHPLMSLFVALVAACAPRPAGTAQPTPPSALPPPGTELLTVAERSDYKATARYEDVVALCDQLAAASPKVHKSSIGTTVEGRAIPLLVIADPPVTTAVMAKASGKPVALLMGNIHAGEVCGKEALMMLARDLATTSDHPLLKDLIVAIVPIYNADGNERFGPIEKNRPGQAGPEQGAGVRENAKGLDLNRDFVKLEAPETRALVRFVNQWDPALIVDTHTTNGSFHRYVLTYDGPRNPAGSAAIVNYVRDTMLGEITRTLKEAYGHDLYFYGNFEPPGPPPEGHVRWETYPAQPRYGVQYFGMRNRLAILSEAYAYAPFKDRVLATLHFSRACLDYLAGHRAQVVKMIKDADAAATGAGREPKTDDAVPIRSKPAALEQKVTLLGYVEEKTEGKTRSTGEARDYECDVLVRSEATASVARPFAYLIPASMTGVVETLQRHGISVEELREDVELDVEAARIDAVTKAMRPFQGHSLVEVAATEQPVSRRMPAGTIVVRTAQPLGSLVVYLLEPASEDGMTTWNFFDESLAVGQEFPVLRLPKATPILTTPVRPLAEDRAHDKPITYAIVTETPPNFSGSPVSIQQWLDDGESYLQIRENRLVKVDALTGRSTRLFDPAPMAAAMAAIPTIGKATAEQWANGASFNMSKDRSAALFNHENDLYYARFDGTQAARLTSTPGAEELATFSPDGRFVAFVRDNDLWVVDVATHTERALTTGGTDHLRNGKADWVYYEEIFNRNWRTYWWSPDSSRIAFFQTDDSMVPRFNLVNDLPDQPVLEDTPYPKPGQPNPTVRLGIVSVAGGPVRWADLSAYDVGSGGILITAVEWWPDSQSVYVAVVNRIQTWMDVLSVPARGGPSQRLFRETTEAWVDVPGPNDVRFLKDGSFLFPSERTGWRQIYHYDRQGKLLGAVTSGEWEARSIDLVDEKGGAVYVSGTKDSPIASNSYRVNLDGSDLRRLTSAPGSHAVSIDPTGRRFVDTWSDRATPTKVMLMTTDSPPAVTRTLDTNPVYALEEYRRGTYELVQIPAADGFVLEASLLKPPGFDPSRKYPVWFSTYAGPHAPTISDSWQGGRVSDEMLAQMGCLVFHADPRSASGKGAVSAWSAYRQLGVPELKDIEDAIRWLTAQPFVDGTRVGISGGSYGGFMTAYAMTHSTLFSAGIATSSPTDWRDYDSIYTERYMGTPQDNPEGYDATSVVKAAKNLHGRLLLIHGTIDDNVHMQNSIRLVKALQDANKPFDFMAYPGFRHGVGARHYRRLTVDFMRDTMALTDNPPPSEEGQGGTGGPGRGGRRRRN